jgi:TolB-like protein/Flp pilus assembly protein TadD
MSADPENEYFSDGITEEIINALAKLPGVQVASRTSSFAFKGKETDIRQVGEKLGVATLLEGSVRKIGNRIRLTAQLVDVSNGYQIWSETYDRQLEDVFAVQEEISRAIVDALKVKLTGQEERLVVPATQNMEAYTMYLKGRFFLHKFTEGSIQRAQEFFKQALALDHRYARAYAGIADCWADMADDWVPPDSAYPQAKAAATKALDLEPDLADAHTSIGKVLCWYEWDFAGAEKSLRHAVQLNPNSAEGQFVLGSCLPCVGQLDDAIAAMRKALTLDPLSGHFSRWLGRFLLYSGANDAAIIQSRKTIEVDPGHFQVYLDIGAAYLALGQGEESLKWYRRGLSLETSVRAYDAMLVRPLASLGQLEEAWPILERLEASAREGYVRAEILAMGYGAAGEFDKAFECLDRALGARSAGLIYLHLDPGYLPLRSDPRFAELVKAVGVR